VIPTTLVLDIPKQDYMQNKRFKYIMKFLIELARKKTILFEREPLISGTGKTSLCQLIDKI